MTRKGALIRVGAVLMTSGLLLAACSSKTPNSATNGNTHKTQSGASALAAAIAATAKGYVGTSMKVDPTSRPAAKGKTIAIISAGQVADSNSVPSNGALEAAKAIGWNATIYDAQLKPSKYAPLVRQAIAAHVNGIILDAIDCDTVKQPLEEARAAGIAVTAMYAFDCNDPHAGGGSSGLFSAVTYYGAKNANLDKFTESYGCRPGQLHHRQVAQHGQDHRRPGPRIHGPVLHAEGVRRHHRGLPRLEIVDTLNITQAGHPRRQDQAQDPGGAAAVPPGHLDQEPLHLRHDARHRPRPQDQPPTT